MVRSPSPSLAALRDVASAIRRARLDSLDVAIPPLHDLRERAERDLAGAHAAEVQAGGVFHAGQPFAQHRRWRAFFRLATRPIYAASLSAAAASASSAPHRVARATARRADGRAARASARRARARGRSRLCLRLTGHRVFAHVTVAGRLARDRTGHRHSTSPRGQRSRCAAVVPAPCSSHHGGRPTLTALVQRHWCPTP